MASKRRLRRLALGQPVLPPRDPYAADVEAELRRVRREEASGYDPELEEMRQEWRRDEWRQWWEQRGQSL